VSDSPRPATRCVHGPRDGDPRGALTVPLYTHATFGFADSAALADAMDGVSDAPLYTRYGRNPTIEAVEAHLAALEGGARALTFASGMAAIAGVILGSCEAGDEVVGYGDLYGGTLGLLTDRLPRLGIGARLVPRGSPAALAAALGPRTRMVWVETPSNPRLDVVDLASVAAVVRAHGATLVVDNTFATPINQSPLALGADVVVHSATKYLGGHSDLTGGVIVADAERIGAFDDHRRAFGAFLAPEVAHLLGRSLRTLAVRVEAHNARAAELAARLERHPAIAAAHYPGLASHPDHAVALRQMRGFGGMVTVVHRGGGDAATAFVERLRLFALAPSLGGVESLVTEPRITTHRGLSADARAHRGIPDGMVRLSIGLEDVEDLWDDLRGALDAEDR
jgi:cystathionine gamma-synthase